MFVSGIAEGGNTGVGIREKSARTPTSRGAGCETHKSGSVGAGGGQPPLATRRAPGMGVEIGGESPLGTLAEGTPSRRGKGASEQDVSTRVHLEGDGAARWRPVEA